MTQELGSQGRSMPRHHVLDGWRGISILCVLAAHMLPLGPKFLQLNSTAAPLGMSLFFTLSGFLITSTLIYHSSVPEFLIRRFCRILPLAWSFLLLVLPMEGVSLDVYLANFLFYANFPPFWLTDLTSHFWSLCVEMQFYLFVAILVGILRQRGLLLLPLFCLASTAWRIWHGEIITIVTLGRVDEILAGACLALIYECRLGDLLQGFLRWINPYLILVLLLTSCHPGSGPVNYLRPYLAATLVGSTLYQEKTLLHECLMANILIYIASISYALYVVHPLTIYGWMGSGDTLVKYTKRLLSFVLTFGLAHISTFYYEKHWIAWGKRWINWRRKRLSM